MDDLKNLELMMKQQTTVGNGCLFEEPILRDTISHKDALPAEQEGMSRRKHIMKNVGAE